MMAPSRYTDYPEGYYGRGTIRLDIVVDYNRRMLRPKTEKEAQSANSLPPPPQVFGA
jgi:hypothetical protein